jgi:hypothetical protein
MCFIEVLGLNSRRSRAVLIGPAAAVASAAGCAASVAAAEVLLQRCLACDVPAKGCSCCTGLASTRLTGSCMLQARHARMLCRQVCITAKMVLLWLRVLLDLQRAHGGYLIVVELFCAKAMRLKRCQGNWGLKWLVRCVTTKRSVDLLNGLLLSGVEGSYFKHTDLFCIAPASPHVFLVSQSRRVCVHVHGRC